MTMTVDQPVSSDDSDEDSGPAAPTVKRVSIDAAGAVLVVGCGEAGERTMLVEAVAVDGYMELVIERGRAWWETTDTVLAKTVGGETVIVD